MTLNFILRKCYAKSSKKYNIRMYTNQRFCLNVQLSIYTFESLASNLNVCMYWLLLVKNCASSLLVTSGLRLVVVATSYIDSHIQTKQFHSVVWSIQNFNGKLKTGDKELYIFMFYSVLSCRLSFHRHRRWSQLCARGHLKLYVTHPDRIQHSIYEI